MKIKLNYRSLLFHHIEPAVICRQRWSSDSSIKTWYLIYKILLVLFFWCNLSYTWYLQDVEYSSTPHWWKYVIYMTHWGIVLFSFSLVVDTSLVLWLYLFPSPRHTSLLLSWFLSTATYSMAVFITAMYWSLLFKWKELPTYSNVFVHFLQAVGAVVDQVVSCRPWHLGHFWVSLLLPLIYMVFSVVYWSIGGTNEKDEPWVYNVLKWGEDPGKAGWVVALGVVAIIAIHGIMWVITIIRDRIHRRILGSGRPTKKCMEKV